MGKGGIPDRWLNYKAVGKRVEGTRFIAFKVPLNQHLNENVESNARFDGKMLLDKVPNLGIIIDLTNTNRYYDARFFQIEGVEHKKLMIPGHITPPQRLVNMFKQFVKSFIEKNQNNDKLIGVHCTHGVNRSGYLICNYMVSEMAVPPNDAIDKFAEARGHKIERNNYLDALQKLTSSEGGKDSNNSTNFPDDDKSCGSTEVRNSYSWRRTEYATNERPAPSSLPQRRGCIDNGERPPSPPPYRKRPYQYNRQERESGPPNPKRMYKPEADSRRFNRHYIQQCRSTQHNFSEMEFRKRSNSYNEGGKSNSLDHYRPRYNPYESRSRRPPSVQRSHDHRRPSSNHRSPRDYDDQRNSLSPSRRPRSNSSSHRNRR